jgi:tRNA threonylcarbamoyl adenosine modification protein YeaZ
VTAGGGRERLLGPGGPLLAVDTATTRAVIALGERDGTPRAERSWVAGYRHGEELLARIEALLRDEDVAPAALGGIVVGTGPGAFTGLRVGLATVKGLAHALALPVVGVGTGEALLAAAGGGSLVLVQPAGPADRVLTRAGEPPRIVAGGEELGLRADETLVAVDLDDRAPEAAATAGSLAHAGLASALLGAGALRLAAGEVDDLATLVPEYVTLPRGVRTAPAGVGVSLTGSRAPA